MSSLASSASLTTYLKGRRLGQRGPAGSKKNVGYSPVAVVIDAICNDGQNPCLAIVISSTCGRVDGLAPCTGRSGSGLGFWRLAEGNSPPDLEGQLATEDFAASPGRVHIAAGSGGTRRALLTCCCVCGGARSRRRSRGSRGGSGGSCGPIDIGFECPPSLRRDTCR